MKKLRIKDKRKFKKAVLIILMSIAIIIGTILFCNYLKISGLNSLFTTNVYKEAFKETSKTDTAVIDFLMGLFIGTVIMSAISLLLEEESEEQEDFELNQILKRNGVMIE